MLTKTLGVLATAALACAGSAAAQTIGIDACDRFIASYESCIADHVPADQRKAFGDSIAQWRQEWSAMAKDNDNRLILTGVCTQVQDQMAQTLAGFGCRF